MANIAPAPSFYPRRISEYVPAMRYSADVNHFGPTRISFGAPAVADPDGILDGTSIATASTVVAAGMLLSEMDAPYGRNITVVASGTATSNVTIHSLDYLGQPMSESFTLTSGTPVVGVKAHKTLLSIVLGATSGMTVDIGPGTKLGLPYAAQNCLFETTDGAKVAAGTLTLPVLTDPQTAITGDPRGLYVPTTTPDGAKVLTAVFDFTNDVNASNHGGLHGIAHFSA